MGKIVAIGGGHIGALGNPIETTQIDLEIITLTGKRSPRALLIPTASGDSDSYSDAFRQHYGERLGCSTDILSLIRTKPTRSEIEDKILGSDLVYVGGGNTLRMMRLWRRLGVDDVLRDAFDRGIVLSGISAGAICWFRFGSSDSRKYANPDASLIRVHGMDIFGGVLCPHYDTELDRRPKLHEMMSKISGVAIALDNCCALEIVEDQQRLLRSKDTAHGYRVYRKHGRVVEEELPCDGDYRALISLFGT
jgi:dipeptidase E